MRRLSALVACLGGVALAALSVGCSSGDPSAPLGSASSAIIDGTTSTPDQDAVVLLVMRSAGRARGTCTGTLVAPNLILTARHCVADTDEGALCSADGLAVSGGAVRGDLDPKQIDVYTGVDAIRSMNDRTKAAAHGAKLVHEGERTLCDSDVAFMVLDRSVQGRVAPIRLQGGARKGERLTAVGWGLTDSGALPTKRMQRTSVPVLGVGPLTIDARNDIGIGSSEFVVGESFCSGDSGGPSLSSKGAVVGVVSRGGGGGTSTTNAAANCIGGDVLNYYTHLGLKSALVTRAFAAAGADPRPEGSPPGAAVGEACKVNLDCSSDACIEGACVRRCDDGSACKDGEICKEHEDKKICALAPEEADPSAAAGAPPPSAAAPSARSTTTTTSGCSAAPGGGAGAAGASGLVLALVAVAAAFARRRR